MKIAKIDILRLTDDDGSGYLFCRIHTDTGLYGDGEAAGICACSGSFGVLKTLGKMIIGLDPFDTEYIWNTMYKSSFWGQNGGPMTFAGMSALDIALWDIKGKYLQQPVYALLGGKCRERFRCYASQLQLGWKPVYQASRHCPAVSLDDYRAVTRAAIDEGFDALKFDFLVFNENGGRFAPMELSGVLDRKYVDLVEKRLAVVRETAGPGVDIIIENHSSFDVPGAIKLAHAVAKYDILYFEEPNTMSPYTAETLAQKINIPLSAGERIYSRFQYVPYFENRSLRVIQPDVGNCGGFTETKKVCAMAYAYDVGVQLHSCGSPLATDISLQLEAVLPNFIIHEHHKRTRNKCMQGLTLHNRHPIDGYLSLSDQPGLGNEITDLAYQQAIEREEVK